MVGLQMAKRAEKGSEKEDRTNRTSAPIQVDKDLARKLGVICQHKGKSQSVVISPVIRRWIETQYEAVSLEIQEEVKQRKASE
jgi:predicted transcriptional regulator